MPRRTLTEIFTRRFLVGLCISCMVLLSGLWGSQIANGAQDFLPPELAFKISAQHVAEGRIQVQFETAQGYYLYRDKFAFAVSSKQVKLGVPIFPAGNIKFDENFQKEVETYHGLGEIALPVTVNGTDNYQLTITSQGCADKGLCYPPQETVINLDGRGATKSTSSITVDVKASQGGLSALWQARHDVVQLGSLLQSLPTYLLLLGFLLLGVSLSFTPCVLPMVPILSSIIVGEVADEKKPHPFALASTYVMGMALVYTAVGVLMALLGGSVSAWLQSPWVIGGFALILCVMAFSMFGVYQLELPKNLQNRLHAWAQRHEGGRYVGVAMMGAISALMVGPCVTAPLAGVLGVIAQTGSARLGGLLLFTMAIGMGVPLLLVGAGAGHWLPKTGPWMERVKHLFGWLLLSLAVWLMSPFMPRWLVIVLAALLLCTCAFWLGLHRSLTQKASVWQKMTKGLSVVSLAMGLLLLAGLVTESRDLLRPFAQQDATAEATLRWRSVSSSDELDKLLASSKQAVMLDFYADWCISCIEMEKLTFRQAAVAAQLQKLTLVRVDVTHSTPQDKALLSRFGLFGPPGIIFFDAQGLEIPGSRVVGYQNAPTFLRSLEPVLGSAPR